MSFLTDYLTYCAENEAPKIYHRWSALVALSSIISRRVWIDQGHYVLYPNIYVILVGGSGSRKSTAMHISRRFMREVGGIPMAAAAETKERLVLDLEASLCAYIDPVTKHPRNYSPLTVCVTEISQFLGTQTAAHMIDFLVTVYDEDIYEYRTKNGPKKEIIVDGPYLVLLGCTTPEWIELYLNDGILSAGFLRRNMFVYTDARSEPIPFPTVTDSMSTAWKAMLEWARKLKEVKGPFTWSPEAKEFYATWYCLHHKQINLGSPIIGYLNGKHDALLKICMLIALSESHELVLHRRHIEEGLRYMDELEESMPRLFAGLGRNELNRVLQAGINILKNHPGYEMPFDQWKIVMYTHAQHSEIKEVLQHGSDSNIWMIVKKEYANPPKTEHWLRLCVRPLKPTSPA